MNASTTADQDQLRAVVDDYRGEVLDRLENFHGCHLLYVGWDHHLMYCAPLAFLVPPDMSFRELCENNLAQAFCDHPDMAKVDWKQVRWLCSGEPFQPNLDASLEDNGLGHKSVLRMQTPGLDGIKGLCI